MKKIDIKKLIPHFTAILLFFAISLVYFSPILQGYQLKQGDIEKHKAMSHEIVSHQEKYEERTLWSGNMFAGMPTYMTATVRYAGSISKLLFQTYRGGLPHPASALFSYLFGFFILLLCLRINPWLAIVGAIAFAFSSYFFVILEAGHTSKAYAISLMAPILGGFILALRGNIKVGMLLIAIFTSLQLYVNHPQISYYLFLVLLFVGIGEMIAFIKKKELNVFFKRIAFIVLAAVLGILPNLGNIMVALEYSKESTRGKSELTITPTGESNTQNVSSGLDKDYITQWSFGIDETFTLIIPNAKGGSSKPILGMDQELERLKKEDPQFLNLLYSEYKNGNVIYSYFGNQPIVSGPVYIGILVVFLALLALVCLKNRLLIPLMAVTILTIMLSWGKNFMGLTEFFIDNVPVYNKFRAVAMILIVAEFTLPIMAILFVDKLIRDKAFIKLQQKKILITSGVFVAILGLTVMNPSTFLDLSSEKEQNRWNSQLAGGNSAQALQVQEQVIEYREDVVSKSAGRSLLILAIGIALILLFLQGKIKSSVLIAALGVIFLGDLWSLNKEYINNQAPPRGGPAGKYASWIKPDKFKVPFEPSPIDQQIFNTEVQANPQIQQNIQNRLNDLKSTQRRLDPRKLYDVQYSELMEATHYRVLNTAARLDQDVRTPYFHKTLGGYHGAKLKKYQELVDFHLGIEHYQLRQGFAQGGIQMVQSMLPSMQVVNMLNSKYIIGPDNTGKAAEVVIGNPYAYGNAWFVNDLKTVENADSAIMGLRAVDTRQTVIIEKGDAPELNGKSFDRSPSASIELTNYSPSELKYSYNTDKEQLAVFSEVYYSPGWKVYVNGEESNFFKANYILRGMLVPAGKGEIVFRFEPSSYKIGQTLSWVSSILMILLIAFVGYSFFKKS